MIGRVAPELQLENWIQSKPLKLRDLRGSVVLLRWWTHGCPYCENSAAALNEFYETYKDDDFIIIGIYHTKPYPTDLPLDILKSRVQQKGFKFPVALDPGWKNLKKYWLDDGPKSFTSVSFLIDPSGKINYVHEGGEYHQFEIEGHDHCVADYWVLRDKIEQLLKRNNP
jgi:peroxiredoxin